jgi:hypothetical protein
MFPLFKKPYYQKLKKFVNFLFIWHHFVVVGKQNMILSGPNIIVTNHGARQEDVFALIKTYPIQLYFLIYDVCFSAKEFDHFLKRVSAGQIPESEKKIGTGLGRDKVFLTFIKIFFSLFKKLYWAFMEEIARGLHAIEAIPVQPRGNNDYAKIVVEKYLLENRKVVFLEYNFNGIPSKYDLDYRNILEFKYGAFNIAYLMFKKYKLSIPITPISIKGTKIFHFFPFSKITINIGRPICIDNYLKEKNPSAALKEEIEKRVVELYRQR